MLSLSRKHKHNSPHNQTETKVQFEKKRHDWDKQRTKIENAEIKKRAQLRGPGCARFLIPNSLFTGIPKITYHSRKQKRDIGEKIATVKKPTSSKACSPHTTELNWSLWTAVRSMLRPVNISLVGRCGVRMLANVNHLASCITSNEKSATGPLLQTAAVLKVRYS